LKSFTRGWKLSGSPKCSLVQRHEIHNTILAFDLMLNSLKSETVTLQSVSSNCAGLMRVGSVANAESRRKPMIVKQDAMLARIRMKKSERLALEQTLRTGRAKEGVQLKIRELDLAIQYLKIQNRKNRRMMLLAPNK
jgi:hypothetical protein